MTQICPKCSYIRKASDEAPAWQCPSCQVAYIKAGGEPVSSNYRRYGAPVVSSKRSSSGMSKWIVAAALIAVGLVAGKPLWSTKAASSQVAPSTAQPTVTLYATEWCGFCAATRELFDKNGIQYTELDVEKTTAGYEGHRKLGGQGVPLIVIGDDVIRGYNEQRIRSDLQPWFKQSGSNI